MNHTKKPPKNSPIYDTAIIGAGASGLMAAISAARAGAKAILLEHMDQAAKKLPATGNGKCNFTNADQGQEHYYCEDPAFLEAVLGQFPYTEATRFFSQLGIRPLQKNGTCIYPESGQAASVRSALLAEIQRLQVPLACCVGIRSIRKIRYKNTAIFEISTKNGTFYSKSCILATGGKAAPKTGSDGSGYLYARQLGHTIAKPLPALTALRADFQKWKLPAGVRVFCTAALYVDGTQAANEQGELQITAYGLSGIVIFQFSRIAAKALASGRKVWITLDFQPQMDALELETYLYGRFHSIYHAHKDIEQCLIGFLPDKLNIALLKRAKLEPGMPCKQCSRKQAANLAYVLKAYQVTITDTNGFDFAQSTAGGVPIQEIHAPRMESKIAPGLFFAGEIIDVDGKCGGYNLQWAWASGYIAGTSSARFCKTLLF